MSGNSTVGTRQREEQRDEGIRWESRDMEGDRITRIDYAES